MPSSLDKWWAWPLIVTGSGASITYSALWVAENWRFAGAAASLAVPIIIVIAARRKLNIGYLSPVVLCSAVLLATGLASAAFGRHLSGLDGGGIILIVPDHLEAPTLQLFGLSAFWFLIGALGVLSIANEAPYRHRRISELMTPGPSATPMLWVVAVAPIALVGAGLGPQLLERQEYLAGTGGSNIFALGQSMGLGSAAICGYLLGRGGFGRMLATGLAISYFAAFFALGSRRMALIPLLIAVGYVAASQRRSWKTMIAAGALAVALLPLPLWLRGLETHGLIPYLGAINNFSYAEVDWPRSLNNVLITYPTTAYSAFVQPSLPVHYLWIELNPLPGQLVGWYDISKTLNLNPWTPYSAVGELGNHGGVVMASVWVFLGGIVAYIETRMRVYLRNGSAFIAVTLLGFVGLFAVQLLQYSLRPSFRMLVYAVLLDAAVRGARLLRSQQSPERARNL